LLELLLSKLPVSLDVCIESFFVLLEEDWLERNSHFLEISVRVEEVSNLNLFSKSFFSEGISTLSMDSPHELLFVLGQNLGVRLKTKMLNLDITCVEFKRLDGSLDSNNIDRSAV
jgi:hypothetical protein